MILSLRPVMSRSDTGIERGADSAAGTPPLLLNGNPLRSFFYSFPLTAAQILYVNPNAELSIGLGWEPERYVQTTLTRRPLKLARNLRRNVNQARTWATTSS